jgi:sulfur transfer complex TusBCD TusB component (DsrH family)
MSLWTRFLIAIGAIEKDYNHVIAPITKMGAELEDLAARKRAQIISSQVVISTHEEVIQIATKAREEANAGAAAVRWLFVQKVA